MKIRILAVGQKMPSWVNEPVSDYLQRMPRECRVEFVELAMAKPRKNDNKGMRAEEGKRMLDAIPPKTRVIALDERGQSWSTMKLSNNMETWLQDGRDVTLLIGGPNGLAPECVQLAEQTWSLSALTLPHPMVRILVAEQLYRGWSVLQNHPYHLGH